MPPIPIRATQGEPDRRATVPSPPVAAAPLTREGLPASQVDIQSAVPKRIEDAGYYSVYGITPSSDGYHARRWCPASA